MDIPTGPHFMFITFILIYYPVTQLTQAHIFIPVFSVQEVSALLHLFWHLPDPVLLL